MTEAKSLRDTAGAVAPFVGAAWLTWLAVLIGSSINWWEYALSCVLAMIAGGLTVLATTGRAPAWLGVVPSALVFLTAVGLLRSSAGGMDSGAGVLALIPVFRVALYGRSRRDLIPVLVGVALFYLLPILIIGAPTYPPSQYRAALIAVAVSSIIGLATQQLVGTIRRQASESLSRERMLEQVSDIVHGLFDSPRVRTDVCQAAMTISDATVALIYEPVTMSGDLRLTAISGVHTPAIGVTPATHSTVCEAFRSGRPILISKDVEAHVGSIALWIAAGRPSSVLFQPLLKGNVPLGVLVVGWPDSVRAEGSRATVIAVLAHEAAAVIDRADAIGQLTDEAQTDPLTGLPNRRAWDAHINRALAENQPVAIAMLDFDHFKQFNDTYGHPAGDRLLKETAAAWRDQIRTGDVLARLGGEEFGLLLINCDVPTAMEVIERLRAHVSLNRTCSAGIAIRRASESAEAVIARADTALYQAKADGRDRTRLSGQILQ